MYNNSHVSLFFFTKRIVINFPVCDEVCDRGGGGGGGGVIYVPSKSLKDPVLSPAPSQQQKASVPQ